jgi:transposase
MTPQQQLTPEVQAERAAFAAHLAAIDPARIKVVDESRVEVGQRLGYGYSARGKRCYDSGPFRSGIVRSLVGWLALDGSGVVATHEGTVKGYTFRGFVRAHLVPHLRPGDVVVWDNARIHGVEGIREMIEACGAELLPLPRYSPDLSPIEPGWSKIKQIVKRLRAAVAEALEEAVSVGVAAVSASDAEGWFRHCGYLHQLN